MRAIVSECEQRRIEGKPVLVVSNKQAAPALAFAREHGIATRVISTAKDPVAADEALATALSEANPDWVILSGYLRKVGPKTLARFSGRILNVHPALLPKYGGQGFYGRRVHEAVLAGGETVTGATVHLVDEIYDHGEILGQMQVPVLPGDTPEKLERRVMGAEPSLFINVMSRLVNTYY